MSSCNVFFKTRHIHDRLAKADGKRADDRKMDTIVGKDNTGACSALTEKMSNFVITEEQEYQVSHQGRYKAHLFLSKKSVFLQLFELIPLFFHLLFEPAFYSKLFKKLLNPKKMLIFAAKNFRVRCKSFPAVIVRDFLLELIR